MKNTPISSLQNYLAGVTDSRQRGKAKHLLESILFIAVTATLANAGSREEAEQFGKGYEEWFSQYVELPNGVPSHDTFERVFKWVDGKEFERCFILWMHEIRREKELGIVEIDGETMRGSGDAKGDCRDDHKKEGRLCIERQKESADPIRRSVIVHGNGRKEWV